MFETEHTPAFKGDNSTDLSWSSTPVSRHSTTNQHNWVLNMLVSYHPLVVTGSLIMVACREAKMTISKGSLHLLLFYLNEMGSLAVTHKPPLCRPAHFILIPCSFGYKPSMQYKCVIFPSSVWIFLHTGVHKLCWNHINQVRPQRDSCGFNKPQVYSRVVIGSHFIVVRPFFDTWPHCIVTSRIISLIKLQTIDPRHSEDVWLI